MKKLNVKILCVVLSIVMCLQTFSTITFAAKPDTANPLSAPQTPSYAVEEVKSLRQANVKHFKMSDGTYTAASYDAPVHYNDGGGWKDIDNTLSEATDAEENTAVYENKDNLLKVKFAKKSNSKNILKLQQGSYKLMFSLLGDVNKHVEAQRKRIKDDKDITTLENIESQVTYENILDNVDIEYILTGTKLKENIVVSKKLKDYTFKYEIKANGLTMSLEDNSIIARDNDKTVFCIPAPYMFDASGEISDAVTYSLEKSNGQKYILKITADKDWMDSPERNFPVTIDPTVMVPDNTNATVITSVNDYIITEYNPASELANDALRYCNIPGYTGDTTRMHLKMSLPFLDDNLKSNSSYENKPSYGTKVVKATLNLAYKEKSYNGSVTDDAVYSVHRITSSWDTISSSNRPTYSTDVEDYLEKDTWKIEHYDAITGETTGIEYQPIFKADITNLVSDWYAGVVANNGVYITPSVPGKAQVDLAYSIYLNSEYHPRIYVSYICSIGLENYFTYTTTDLDGLGTGNVNNLTGALNFSFTDYTSPNNRNGITLSHIYNDEYTFYDCLYINDNTNNKVNMGKGFKLNIQQTVYYDPQEKIWTHLDADGTYHYYYPKDDTNSEFISQEGLGTKLIPGKRTPPEDYHRCTIETKSGTKYIFENYRLQKIVDKNDNTIEIIYDSYSVGSGGCYYPVQVKEILNDNQARIINLEWLNDGERLSKMTFPEGGFVTYTYDNSDPSLLKEVTFSSAKSYTKTGNGDNTKLTFTYTTVNGSKVLKTVTNNNTDKTVTFNRKSTTDIRVSQILGEKEDAVVENTGFIYRPMNTTVEENITPYYSTTFIFNSSGQTSYVTDSEGNSKKYEYSDSAASENKISFQSNIRRVAENRIKNGNFNNQSTQYWSGTATYDTMNEAVNIPAGGSLSQQVTINTIGEYTLSAKIQNDAADVVLEITNGTTVLKKIVVGPTDGLENKQLPFFFSYSGQYTIRIRSLNNNCLVKSVQLSKGVASDEFNLLSNSSFSDGVSGWIKTGFVNDVDEINDACTMVGDYRTKKMLSQTINVDDSPDTVYVFGAMVQADCLPNKDNGDGTDTCVAITLEMDYGDGEKDYKTVFCEPKTGDNMVNLFGSVKAPYGVDKLRIYLKNLYNYGEVKFDDVYLFRDADGTYYNYDNNGNLSSTESASGAYISAEYSLQGDMINSVDPFGRMTVYEYDTNRNLERTYSPMGVVQNNVYDSYGNITSTYLSKWETMTQKTTLENGYTTYDANGMYKTKSTNAYGVTTDYDVNPTTLKLEEIRYVKPSDQSDRYNYRVNYDYYDDAGGSQRGPLKHIYARYELYDELQYMVSFEYAKGKLNTINRYGYSYKLDDYYGEGGEYVDEGYTRIPYNFKNTTRVVNSAGNSLDIGKNLYDAKGRLTATIYGGSNYHRFDNDVLGRLVTKHTLNDKFTYTYNSKGYLSSVESQNTKISQIFSYDPAGRMSVSELYDENSGINLKHKYTYDLADRTTGINRVYTNENGQKDIVYTAFDYDADGRITNQHVYNESSGSIYLVPEIVNTYNRVGMLTRTQYKSANQVHIQPYINRDISYKNIDGDPDRLTSAIDTYDGYSYTYDDAGNIKSVSSTADILGNATYTYDEMNHLLSSSSYYGDEQFSYDLNGNITKQYFESGKNYVYDNLWSDRLLTVKDDNGNIIRQYEYSDQYGAGSTMPVSDGKRNFNWDGRQLVEVSDTTNGSHIYFKYNDNGRRIEKEVIFDGGGSKTTKYYYTGDQLTTEVNYNGNIAETKIDYIYDSTGLAFVVIDLLDNANYNLSTGKYIYYVTRNAVGDVTALTDITNGTMGEKLQYTYSAYGMKLSFDQGEISKLAALSSIQYKSYSYDSDLKMYYLNSRWYDPEIARFISADGYVSTGQEIDGYNMFAYCGNNPINRADPNGNWLIQIIATLVIAAGIIFGASSCTTKGTGGAVAYTAVNTIEPNCYGYALQRSEAKYIGGEDKKINNYDVDILADVVMEEVKDVGRSIRKIDSYDSPIKRTEYRIAFRTGEEDYHFMMQNSDGTWSHKPGVAKSRLIDGENPEVVAWDKIAIDKYAWDTYGDVIEDPSRTIPNYYNSHTVYFAVSAPR